MISFTTNEGKFNFRIAGVLIKDDKLLIHRGLNDNFYALPGGRVEMQENSEETLIREMHEELGINAKIERLLYICENFFSYENLNFHEICFIYLISAEDTIFFGEGEFKAKENELLFMWKDIDKLKEVALYPSFLSEEIKMLPKIITHKIIYDDRFLFKYYFSL